MTSDYIVGEIMASNPDEVESVFSFFEKHLNSNVIVSTSLFEGFFQRERMQIHATKKQGPGYHLVYLYDQTLQRELIFHLDLFSLIAMSKDQKEVELSQLLGSNVNLRVTISEDSTPKL